ncbi:hypothetical protein A6V39_00420 [Candidatus Mycoplasma haematobovis]|uniref:Uncharacterized protein n=1 Tax=Candidatus Mycoplasma haematobovis TaxID=432608 RepID=A0A1A9QEF6_9MOLU|nr:hypothetical protein A6V39_00420 [Candidatus Mycoplasma haematobovis]
MLWCILQPKTIRELLLKEQIKLLDTEGTTNDGNWKVLATKHKENTVTLADGKTIAKINQLVITDLEGNQGVNFSLLKEKCKTLLEESTSNKETATLKDNAINWCSEKSPLLPKPSTTSAVRPSGDGNSRP